MARSKRRCATSLHEVAKCTLPSWRSASCATAAGARRPIVAAVASAMAAALARRASLVMGDPPRGGGTGRRETRPFRPPPQVRTSHLPFKWTWSRPDPEDFAHQGGERLHRVRKIPAFGHGPEVDAGR